MGFRAVDDDALQSELLGDTDGGGNVVRPVGVNVDGQLPSDHGQQGLQLGVIVGLVLLLVLRGSFQLLSILQGLGQVFPDDGGGSHTGDRGFMPLVVNAFWIFSQSQLHGRRCLDHHGVHPLSGGLNGGELTGDGVGGAGPVSTVVTPA